jgi:hypothetical protein
MVHKSTHYRQSLFTAKIKIGNDIEIVTQSQALIDCLDPQLSCSTRIVYNDFVSPKDVSPRVGPVDAGDDFDQFQLSDSRLIYHDTDIITLNKCACLYTKRKLT